MYYVSWDDAQEFSKKLVSRSMISGFRLPTEAEWEYAARGRGKRVKYSGGDEVDKVAWHLGNCIGKMAWFFKKECGGKTQPVGGKAPNELCLHDMSGNVWEWCLDWFDENYYAVSPRNNPQGPASGTKRVLRGGSFFRDAGCSRATFRWLQTPDHRNGDIGFRVVLSQGQ